MKALWMLQWLWPGDSLIRALIRRLNRQRLSELAAGGIEAQVERKNALYAQLRQSPRAICTGQANQQHYEVPPAFFQRVLGKHLKYSSGYWPEGVTNLDQAERAMLELYRERAQLSDGQRVLDLGCGWGSLSLWMAEEFPNSRILAVSNSAPQRVFIEEQARLRGLSNLEVWTVDINRLELPSQEFDRIVSVEMLEHVRNYAEVLQLLEQSLAPGGKLFVHVFAHRQFAYTFDPRGQKGLAGDWMEREFFSGGMMPALDTLPSFAGSLELESQWAVCGSHYQKTSNAWLERLRQGRSEVQHIFRSTYGKAWRRYWVGWQLFFLACAELFGQSRGQEWLVAHYRWTRSSTGSKR